MQQTLDILNYFQPPSGWVMENPQTGLLKNQDCVMGVPYYDIDYCKHGMPYRKRTRLWNNLTNLTPRPLCLRDCESIRDDGKHQESGATRNATNQGRRARAKSPQPETALQGTHRAGRGYCCIATVIFNILPRCVQTTMASETFEKVQVKDDKIGCVTPKVKFQVLKGGQNFTAQPCKANP